MAPVALAPEIASFDCGSLNFGERVFINSPSFLRELAHADEAIRRQTGDRVLRAGPRLERAPPDRRGTAGAALLVPVRARRPRRQPAGGQATRRTWWRCCPPGAHWSVCGIGRGQLPLGMAAMAMGGHVRTGLEDNIWYHKGELAESNAQLVARLGAHRRANWAVRWPRRIRYGRCWACAAPDTVSPRRRPCRLLAHGARRVAVGADRARDERLLSREDRLRGLRGLWPASRLRRRFDISRATPTRSLAGSSPARRARVRPDPDPCRLGHALWHRHQRGHRAPLAS